MKIGIMGAMKEEVQGLVHELKNPRTQSYGGREYHEGKLWGTEVIIAFSRWGKVASATTATHMISVHKIDKLIFTGVAGGVAHGLSVGDVVIGSELIQHDLDARPIFARHEIPLIGKSSLHTDEKLRAALEKSVKIFMKKDFAQIIGKETQNEFGIHTPKTKTGAIASGDQFFASQEKLDELRTRLPEVLCVEMEGAAVAQVCHDYGIPYGIIRTISDSADEHAPIHFPRFCEKVASAYSHGILKEFFQAI